MSAIKVDGQRAYARVRAGEAVELAARPVTVSAFDRPRRAARGPAGRNPTGPRPDVGPAALDVDVTVVCSSGTYIRALARDLGAALGVGGHLTALRRTRVGGYGLALARTLDELAATPDDVPLDVLPLADAARGDLPGPRPHRGRGAVAVLRAPDPAAVRTPADRARRVRRARRPDARRVRRARAGRPVAGIGPDGTLVALLQAAGPQARPVVVFAPA